MIKIIFTLLIIAVLLLVLAVVFTNPFNVKKIKFKNIDIDNLYKKVIGSLIISFFIFLSIRYVKVFPVHMKIALIALNVSVTYLVIKFFFINKK